MLLYIGNTLIIIGIIFMFIGIIGIYKYDNFYIKILTASQVDTVGMVTIFLGIVLRSNNIWFALKVGLILFVSFIVNPITSQTILSAAYKSNQLDKDINAIEEESNDDNS